MGSLGSEDAHAVRRAFTVIHRISSYLITVCRTWHNDTRNIERTNEVIRMIIDEFKDMSGVVSAIAPMNE